jgi:hypothetical protein
MPTNITAIILNILLPKFSAKLVAFTCSAKPASSHPEKIDLYATKKFLLQRKGKKIEEK